MLASILNIILPYEAERDIILFINFENVLPLKIPYDIQYNPEKRLPIAYD